MNIEKFMHGLDVLYANHEFDKIEPYLLEGLKMAGDSEEALVILNDLMGYYRAVSRHEDMVRGADKVLSLINKMKLENTISHGTSLLNIATGYRAAGKYKEAEVYYFKALEIFERCIKGPDYKVATLYNNLGLLYTQTNRLKEAKKCIEKALSITVKLQGTEAEVASTYVNLGNVCFMLGENKEGKACMEKAVNLYEALPGLTDTHYPAALAGLGQAEFTEGNLEKSVDYYKKALDLIESMYGRNDDFKTTYENMQIVKDLIARRDAMKVKNLKGMEMSKAYFEEVGLPLLNTKYRELKDRIAVGLVGEGSECLGFDDEFSTDHDFGPAFCMWLTDKDYKLFGEELAKDYDELPKSWHGIPVRNTTKEGRGRVGVHNIDTFFEKYVGYKHAPKVNKTEDIALMDNIPQEMLRTVTNGEIFADECGELTSRRKEFAYYPEAVRLYKLSSVLHKMAQSGQYNYLRGLKRGDTGMMYICISEFINAAVEAGYLLNKIYMPFYKWKTRGMQEFTCLKNLRKDLEILMMQRPDDSKNTLLIEKICVDVVKELQHQGLSNSNDTFLDSQKDEVLIRMTRSFDVDNKEFKESSIEKTTKQKLVDAIVDAEWNQFQYVHNEGGRAECQDNPGTFKIMRSSQFLAWDEQTLKSYLSDLKEGEATGWNLITEKYARMMEHTDPIKYLELAPHLPKLNPQRIMLQEAIIGIMVQWTKELHDKYPALAGNSRNRLSSDDTKWNTSSETYLRGEISTYSDATLKSYTKMVQDALREGRNIVSDILENTVHMYGYASFEDAERSIRR